MCPCHMGAGPQLRELGSDSCRQSHFLIGSKFGLSDKHAPLSGRRARAPSLMEKRASHQRQQARQNGTLGRRVDPNNLSRAECKVLIEAICQRSQEKGKNILTEMWERYDRRVMNLQPVATSHSPRLI